MKKHICIFIGARPNFMKVAPLMRAIENSTECVYQLVYAGAADDPTLEDSLFSDLQIARPNAYLGVTCENLSDLLFTAGAGSSSIATREGGENHKIAFSATQIQLRK